MSTLTIPALFTSHKRSQRKVYPRYSLLKINNVKDRASAKNYIGNAVLYKDNQGVITRVHGNSGVVMARFKRNLPPQAIGSEIQVCLWKVGVDELFN